MSKHKKIRLIIHYVKPTAQLLFKIRFPKGGPTSRRQVVNPRHQRRKDNQLQSLMRDIMGSPEAINDEIRPYLFHVTCFITIYIYIYIYTYIWYIYCNEILQASYLLETRTYNILWCETLRLRLLGERCHYVKHVLSKKSKHMIQILNKLILISSYMPDDTGKGLIDII